MSEQRIGHCLPLYLNNRLLLSAIEDDEMLPQELGEDHQLLSQFRERAADQALSLLEDVYLSLVAGSGSPVPYRTDRRSQRKTVREYWYMDGRVFRTRERVARCYWSLYLGMLRDKGPTVALILGPQEPASPLVFDNVATQAAPLLDLKSSNPRDAFTHKTGYDVGVVAAYAPLASGQTHKELVAGMKTRLDVFLEKLRAPFEAALDA
jgi:hypothetical protein